MGEVLGLEAQIDALLARLEGAESASPAASSGGVRPAELKTVNPSGDQPDHVREGAPWPGPRGEHRWRLSPTTRTLTRLSDGQDLAVLIGKESAATTVTKFLQVRSSGGRVFVDNQGNAVTPIDGRMIYLGRIETSPPVATTVLTQAGGTLRSDVVAVLLNAPGSSAREIAYQLRRTGRSVTKSEINSLLYDEKGTFQVDGTSPPRWRVVSSAGSAASETRATEHASSRTGSTNKPQRRSTVDAYRDLVREGHAPAPRVVRTRSDASPRPEPQHVLELMTWQREAIAAWYANGCQGIVEAVTGTGKTHLGLEAVAHATRDGQKSTVLVPSVDLQDQWADRFSAFLPNLNVARIGGRKIGDPRKADVTIAVVNSALRQDLSHLSPDSLLVADEVHRYGADQFQYALRANYTRRLGLTATLERSGDDAVEEVLAPYFGGSIMQVGFDRAIREKVVAPFRLVMAPISLSEEEQAEYDELSRQISNGLKVLRNNGALRGGNANITQELGRLRGAGGEIGRAARIAETGMRKRRHFLAAVSGKLDAVEELSEMIGVSQGTVIFTQSKEMAESAALVLREWDVAASALHSDMNDRERRDTLDGLTDGSLQALAAPKLLDEGIDVPTVDLGIVMTASKSRRQMVQRLGRVIRRKDDGRAVNFVILYAKGTVEDPASGVHEGFFDLVGEVATNKVVLDPGWTADAVLGF